MTKKMYRFFGGMTHLQENWLNKMALNGYRLVRTTKMLYEFEKCELGAYQYKVEFIADKSKSNAENYKAFLEGWVLDGLFVSPSHFPGLYTLDLVLTVFDFLFYCLAGVLFFNYLYTLIDNMKKAEKPKRKLRLIQRSAPR